MAEFNNGIKINTYITTRYKIEVINTQINTIFVDFIDFYFFLLSIYGNIIIKTNIPFQVTFCENVNLWDENKCILSLSYKDIEKYLSEKYNLVFTILLSQKCFELIKHKRIKIQKFNCNIFLAKYLLKTNCQCIKKNEILDILEIYEEFKLSLCSKHFFALSALMYAKYIF